MAGRHAQRTYHRASARLLLAAAGMLVAGSVIAAVAPADASSQTVNAQLSLSGVATADNPTGGTTIGIHPGDKVTFKASTAPTAGLDKLGLGGLIGGLLDGAATYQVTADFSGLPGGSKNTVLSGSKTKTFTFNSKGTFSFTWSAQSVTVLPVLGQQITQIQLDGNALKSKGIALNANNQYVGKVVVAVDPPQGGIGIQLPSVGAKPSITHVGNLPSVGVPGVTLPTIHTSVPNLLPTGGTKTTPGSGGKGSSGGGSIKYTPPAQGIPEQVVPSGAAGNVYPGSDGGGVGAIGGDTNPGGGGNGGARQLPVANAPQVNGDGVNPGSATPSKAKARQVDLASSDPSPSGQLPVLLAILAIIALAVVAGTYARLYLLRKA